MQSPNNNNNNHTLKNILFVKGYSKLMKLLNNSDLHIQNEKLKFLITTAQAISLSDLEKYYLLDFYTQTAMFQF